MPARLDGANHLQLYFNVALPPYVLPLLVGYDHLYWSLERLLLALNRPQQSQTVHLTDRSESAKRRLWDRL